MTEQRQVNGMGRVNRAPLTRPSTSRKPGELYKQRRTAVRGALSIAADVDNDQGKQWEAQEVLVYQACGRRKYPPGRHGVTHVATDAARFGKPASDYMIGELMTEGMGRRANVLTPMVPVVILLSNLEGAGASQAALRESDCIVNLRLHQDLKIAPRPENLSRILGLHC